jgi:hypothetical protein
MPDTDENPATAVPSTAPDSNVSGPPVPEGSAAEPVDSPDTTPASPAPDHGATVPAGPDTAPETGTGTEQADAPASPAPPAAGTPGPATGQPAVSPVPVAPETAPPAVLTGGGRLAPGGLRQLVIDHLTAHPAEAFTATGISRVIDRSSGAIANALVTLVKQGQAEQVTDRPRTYCLAKSAEAASSTAQ